MAKFRVTDGSVNSHGFRILTEGIDCALFDKNPVMLFMHIRPWSKDDPLPPGKWINRTVEGDAMFMEPEFDATDDYAMKIKSKVDQGMLNMASIGIDIIETSMDPKYLLPGQTRETVTKCILKECSICDVGSNFNALKLYRDGKEIKLADGEDNEILPLIKQQKNMKSIAIKLGLADNSTEDQILAKIGEILAAAEQSKTANTELATTLKKINDDKATALVDEAIASKKITADKKETFLKMASNDFETCKAVLSAIHPQVKPSDVIAPGSKAPDGDKDDWKTLCDKGHNAVEKCKMEEPEHYRKLYRDHYGFEAPRD